MVTYMLFIVKGIFKGLKAKLQPHFARWCTAKILNKAKPSDAYQFSLDATRLEDFNSSEKEKAR
jgi:hypothetical protein